MAKPVIRVLFIPGRNKAVKTYRCYFPRLCLEEKSETDVGPRVILCHSRGIEAALEYPGQLPIVVMDASGANELFRKNRHRMSAYINARRKDDFPWGHERDYETLVFYAADTHHPYMVKRIRDAIQAECARLATRH